MGRMTLAAIFLLALCACQGHQNAGNGKPAAALAVASPTPVAGSSTKPTPTPVPTASASPKPSAAPTASPTAAGPRVYSGTTSVAFFNGQNISTFVSVTLPENCNQPVITAQTLSSSIACSSTANPQTLGYCPNYQGNTSQLLHAYVGSVTPSEATFYLEAEDGVCVGLAGSNPTGTPCAATSPAYPIDYLVVCQ